MINEAIQFVETYRGESETSSKERLINQIAEKYPKIVIINVRLSQNSLILKGNPILLTLEPNEELSNVGFKDTRKWLNKYSDYKILERLNFERYIDAMTEYRKCIGSISGLMSFSLFHFRTRGDWFSYDSGDLKYSKKIGRFKLSTNFINFYKRENSDKDTKIIKTVNDEKKGVRSVYRKLVNYFLEKTDVSFEDLQRYQEENLSDKNGAELSKDLDSIKSKVEYLKEVFDDVYVYLNITDNDIDQNLFKNYLSFRLFITRNTIKEGICPICGDEDKIGTPSPYNTLAKEKKPYNTHLTRFNPLNLQICVDCTEKLNIFERILNEYSIDFFPLFIQKQEQVEEINYLKESENLSFFDILEHIQDIQNTGESDFILLHQTQEILFYDYINNYPLHLGQTHQYLYQNNGYNLNTKRSLRQTFREREILGLRNTQIFRDNIGKVDNPQKYLIYKYRQKIFDLIYRNREVITDKNLKEIITQIIDDRIRNGIPTRPYYDERQILDIYLNSDLFIQKPGKMAQKIGGINMLEKIRKEKEKIVNQGQGLEIDSDEKFGYYLGQLVYHLVEQSETQNKMNLLTPILDCQSKESIKRTVAEKYLDKYYHKLSDYKDFRHRVITKTLNYLQSDLKSNFNQIKVPFYIGFFDENIFYQKQKNLEEDK